MTRAASVSRPKAIRLGPWHQRWVYTSLTTLWLSGMLWLGFHYFISISTTFGSAPHSLERWWLRLHGLAVIATLPVLGSLAVDHAARAWRLRKNRWLGAVLTVYVIWLALSGYALYYFVSDTNQTWLSLLHWIPGAGLVPVVAMHVHYGRRRGRHAVSSAGRL